MRKCALAAAIPALALVLTVAGCGGGNDKPTGGSTAPLGWLAPSPTAPTPSSTAYPKLTKRDFTLVYYVPADKRGEWRPETGSRGLPILIAGSDRVTAFRLNGVTCQVTLDNYQATPARVLIMAAAARQSGLKPGTFDYQVGAQGGGTVRVGGYVCK